MAVAMLILSVLYHFTEKFFLEVFDTIFALGYMATGPYLLWVASASLEEWLLSIQVSAIAVGVYVQSWAYRLMNEDVRYLRWHGSWHVAAASVATIIYVIRF